MATPFSDGRRLAQLARPSARLRRTLHVRDRASASIACLCFCRGTRILPRPMWPKCRHDTSQVSQPTQPSTHHPSPGLFQGSFLEGLLELKKGILAEKRQLQSLRGTSLTFVARQLSHLHSFAKSQRGSTFEADQRRWPSVRSQKFLCHSCSGNSRSARGST